MTELIKITGGVRQGGILSAPEFSSFMDRAVKDLQDLGLGIHYSDTILLTILLLMDDVTLTAETPHELQILLNTFFSFACRWHLTINFSKSKIMVYGHFIGPLPLFQIGNAILDICDSYKYVGEVIDNKGTLMKHLNLKHKHLQVLKQVSTSSVT